MTPHPVRPGRVVPAISLAAFTLCLAFHHQPAKSDEPAAVVWHEDYGSALELARAGNRLLWIQFTGPWCPNCTRMERDSFPHPAIVEHSERSFLPLKLRSDLNEELVAAFNLTAIPATVIVAPNRDVIGFHQGYLGPLELDGLLRDCLARHPVTSPRQAQPGEKGQQTRKPQAKDEKQVSEAELALAGYCAVSLIEDRKLVKGVADHSVVHEGRIYRFVNLSASERFRQEPNRYRPWNDGACLVTHTVDGLAEPGEPRFGALYAGRLFVFASESKRRRFLENPDQYATAELLAASGSPSKSSTRPQQGQ
jgi:YHS domain-containing protein